MTSYKQLVNVYFKKDLKEELANNIGVWQIQLFN